MTIAFVAANHGAGSGVSSITFALDVGSTADRFVAVLAGDYSVANDSPPTGVTYAGSSLTAGTEFISNSRKFRLYWGATTATGSNNVVVTYANASSVVYAIAIAYSGVDQTTPIRGSEARAEAANAVPSITISSDAADTVTMLILGSANRTFAATAPATERYDVGTLYFALDEAGASSVTIDGVLTGGIDQWAAAAVSMIAASGGGDTTAPVLSSPTGTATGSTTATVGATTDEANGTLYAVVTTSATQPSAAQIKAGQDHTGTGAAWAGSQAVGSTGAKTLNATGLTASTGYYAHLIHTDAAANDSNIVSSAQFTTTAQGVNPPVPVRAFPRAILNH